MLRPSDISEDSFLRYSIVNPYRPASGIASSNCFFTCMQTGYKTAFFHSVRSRTVQRISSARIKHNFHCHCDKISWKCCNVKFQLLVFQRIVSYEKKNLKYEGGATNISVNEETVGPHYAGQYRSAEALCVPGVTLSLDLKIRCCPVQWFMLFVDNFRWLVSQVYWINGANGTSCCRSCKWINFLALNVVHFNSS